MTLTDLRYRIGTGVHAATLENLNAEVHYMGFPIEELQHSFSAIQSPGEGTPDQKLAGREYLLEQAGAA